MNALKVLFEVRITELNKIKQSIGKTDSRSYERLVDWIDGLLHINQVLLDCLK